MRTFPDPRHVNTEHPLFDPIWQAIKGWDIEREHGQGYAGATGTDVQVIIDALLAAPPAAQPTGELATNLRKLVARFDQPATEEELRENICAHCGDVYSLEDGSDPSDLCWKCGYDAWTLAVPLLLQAAAALDTQTAQPGSAQDFSDLAALEGPLGTAELYLRMIEPDDPDTSVPDGLAAARKRLALHVSLTPQPVTPVEGKVTVEMVERVYAAYEACTEYPYNKTALCAALCAALGQPVDAQGKV